MPVIRYRKGHTASDLYVALWNSYSLDYEGARPDPGSSTGNDLAWAATPKMTGMPPISFAMMLPSLPWMCLDVVESIIEGTCLNVLQVSCA